MINRNLVRNVQDQESLLALLGTAEEGGGLGWPVAAEFAFEEVPEIAQGVKGDGKVRVSRLIPAGDEHERLVILAEFERTYLRHDLREMLASLRRFIRQSGRFEGTTGSGDTIFIVAGPQYNDLRFVLFEDHDQRVPRIRSFGWRSEFVGRTVLTHNLERLSWSNRLKWEDAWDVEGLTEKFYVDYRDVFASVLSQVQGAPDDKIRHSWTQLLFNRLLFLAFIQRMGWLQVPNGSRDGYLFDLFRGPRGEFGTFYGMLRAVFAELDTQPSEQGKDRFAETIGHVPYLNGGLFDRDDPLDRPDITLPDQAFQQILGEPHGLFARYNFTVTESTPLDQEVAVDPEMLGKIFERLINASERHGSGTYYTPRPIVEFMVNEALKGYLVERGLSPDKAVLLIDHGQVESEAISFKPTEMQNVLDWLFEVRAIDPACGSGAYLLMLLQRLFELVDRLEVSREKRRNDNQKHLYETKLRLLQRCVYGVDQSETAVRIARLRMWLSLVVENRGEKPDPLPNFDYLIMQGDSLASPLFPDQHVLGYPTVDIREYSRMKRRFFHPSPDGQRPTREEMKAQRQKINDAFADELSDSKLRAHSPMPFDWEVEFAEVFDSQESEHTLGGRLNLGPEGGRHGQGELAAQAARLPGFDIVLANPPYVNSGELLRNAGRDYKDALVAAYPKTATGTADLLVYFMERAIDLLRPGGQFAFITSNKWLKAAYGKKLRGQMAVRTQVHHLIDFGDLPVFQGTIAYPLITLATKRVGEDKSEGGTRFTSVTSLNPPYPDLPTIIEEWGGDLPPGSLGREGTWRLETGEAARRLAKMRERGVPLGEYVKGRIYRGVLTGLNEVKIGSDGRMYGKSVPPGVRVVRKEGVFVIDGAKRAELIAEDPKSAEIIKPLAVGKDIKRWVVEPQDRWLVFTRRGINLGDYPAIRRHLERYRERLEPRPRDWDNRLDGEWPGRKPGSYQWYEIQDDIAYWREFENPMIAYPDMSQGARYALGSAGTVFANTCYIAPGGDLYLLAVLNSVPFNNQLAGLLNANLSSTQRAFSDRLLMAIVPVSNAVKSTEIVELCRKILAIRSSDPDIDITDLEAEIDRRVEFLYFGEGDSYEDALAKDQGDLRALLRSGVETDALEFKETLWHDVRLNSVHGDRVADVMRAICAMLNRDGGVILIGVDDDAKIVGIERDLDKLESVDRFQRKLQEAFGVKLRPDPSDLIRIRFIPIDGKQVCRVDVQPDKSTMYTLDNKVYLRRAGASVEIAGPDLAHWWQRRQAGEP